MNAIIVVDLQNDFCEDGALPVPGGNTVAAKVVEHLRATPYDLVVTSQDWHLPNVANGGHFGDPPDYKDTWPAHCVIGTDGAKLHPDLTSGFNGPRVEIRKGIGAPAYSAFEGIASDGRTLEMVLAAAKVQEVTIVGLAADYCVRATALDALRAGFLPTLRTDLTAAVGGPNALRRVVHELGMVGVLIDGGVEREKAAEAPSLEGIDIALTQPVQEPQG